MTDDHIATFIRDGICVVEGILTDEQVEKARHDLHVTLLKYGINHEDIMEGKVDPPADARIKSNASNIFYSKFKLDIFLSEQIHNIFHKLMSHTFLPSDVPEFEHPFGRCTDVLPYIDRICYRLPDHIRPEGGLAMHIDREPNMYSIKKFRPIQGFLTLTDHYGGKSGGLKVVKGFHHEFEDYFGKTTSELCDGDFYRMHGHEHTKVAKRLEAIDAPKGSLVLWDNRLPHSTCSELMSFDSREVLYMSYLPNTPINVEYHKKQKKNFVKNVLPPSCPDPAKADRDYDLDALSPFQRLMLGL